MLFQIEHHSTDSARRLRLRYVTVVRSVGELHRIVAEVIAADELALTQQEPIAPTSERRLVGDWGELRFAPTC